MGEGLLRRERVFCEGRKNRGRFETCPYRIKGDYADAALACRDGLYGELLVFHLGEGAVEGVHVCPGAGDDDVGI